ncbi:MAG: oxidoreductase, partial [Acidobacteriota bacterium]
FRNKNEKAFFDAIACWDPKNCIAMSDPVDGKFLLIETTNGNTWSVMDSAKMPAAKDGEGAFAASGTCLIANGKNSAFLISGGTDTRVFRTRERGRTWEVVETPIAKGPAAGGIFSVAFRNDLNGIIVGGNYNKPDAADDNLAFTRDGGNTWNPGQGLSGYRSAGAYLNARTVIAVGTNGTDISLDGGRTWEKIGTENLNAVAAKGTKAVWAVGPEGLIVKMTRLPK